MAHNTTLNPDAGLLLSIDLDDADLAEIDAISGRLRSELDLAPYADEAEIAKLLRVSRKTLQNDRCTKRPRYPLSIRFGGSRVPRYPRGDVIAWMALEEFLGRRRRIHRCEDRASGDQRELAIIGPAR